MDSEIGKQGKRAVALQWCGVEMAHHGRLLSDLPATCVGSTVNQPPHSIFWLFFDLLNLFPLVPARLLR